MKKKKKTGTVAIPFLITFLISLVIIGGTAMFIYDKITYDESSLIPMVNEVGTLSDKDNHTILFVLDISDSETEEYYEEETNEENYEDEYDYDYDYDYDEDGEEEPQEKSKSYSKQPYTFMIMRSQPVDKKLTFLGIPSNMLLGKDNKKAQDIYSGSGSSELIESIEYTLGINIDRHMNFKDESFKKLCNILGGVSFAVPKEIEGITASDGEQYLSAEQIEDIITYGGYSGGEMQRISTASSLITAMMNQTNGERIAGNLDNNFNTIINLTESDISAIDYNNRKYAIKFMLKYSDPTDNESHSTRAQFITPYGSEDGNSFVADTYFAEDIKVYFDTSETETSAETTQPDTKESEKSKKDE